jgi:oligoribonuclease (3'-5' exoribonuclease)
MEKLLMIDIETTGLKKGSDTILQIGILECIKNPTTCLYVPARTFNKLLFFDEVVIDEWILKTHKDLLPLCKTTEYQAPAIVRAEILAFFKQCGLDKPTMSGLNIGTFDLPFLEAAGYLKPEDYHYRLYDVTTVIKLAQDVFNCDSKTIYSKAQDESDLELPEGSKHESIFDCYYQLKTLNGVINLLR